MISKRCIFASPPSLAPPAAVRCVLTEAGVPDFAVGCCKHPVCVQHNVDSQCFPCNGGNINSGFMFQESTFLAERPSADESTVSNTLPFDFTKPDSTSDIEQSNDNEIRPRPENLDSEAGLAPEAPLSSEADVTSLPDGLDLEDGNWTPHLVTAPELGRDSVDSLEWLSSPNSLDGKLMPLTEA